MAIRRRSSNSIRRVVSGIDPALPLANVRPLEAVAGAAIAARRLTLWLVAAFGLTALFLAVVGIYGVMNQAVRQRTHEFGVRQALGATRGDILRLVLSSGAILSVVGLCGGVLLAILSTRLFAVDALPRQRVRSAHVCVRHAGAARRRVVRGVPPGTARDAREPVDGATGDGIVSSSSLSSMAGPLGLRHGSRASTATNDARSRACSPMLVSPATERPRLEMRHSSESRVASAASVIESLITPR